MKKLRLGFLAVVIGILIVSFLGCKSEQKIDDQLSPSATAQPKQDDTVNQVTTMSPSAYVSTNTEYRENLCIDKEEVVFSFKLANSPKILSVCIAKDKSDYIVYRFGTKDKVELEFPQSKADSWSKFTYSYFLRGGGAENEGMDLNYLTFQNGGYEYKIYQEYTAKDNETRVGVKITDIATKKETVINGLSNSIVGSLIQLRENSKIKIESL